MKARRKFLTSLLLAWPAFSAFSVADSKSKKTSPMQNLFVHHVYFWLKDPSNPVVRKKFEQALEQLVTVETIQSSHLGVPAGTSRSVIDASYSYSLLTIFKNKGDQDIYQEHPKHLKFIEDCKDLWEKVVVYDSVDIPR